MKMNAEENDMVKVKRQIFFRRGEQIAIIRLTGQVQVDRRPDEANISEYTWNVSPFVLFANPVR
jgi:hypothetical protein